MADVEEQLNEISRKLDSIERKTISKQWFSIAMVVVTAVVGGFSYMFEKSVDAQYAQKIASQKVFGEKGAEATIQFIAQSTARLAELRTDLEEFCRVSPDAADRVLESASKLTTLTDKAYVEKSVRDAVETAIDFVANDLFDITSQAQGAPTRDQVCGRAEPYLDRATNALEALLSFDD